MFDIDDWYAPGVCNSENEAVNNLSLLPDEIFADHTRRTSADIFKNLYSVYIPEFASHTREWVENMGIGVIYNTYGGEVSYETYLANIDISCILVSCYCDRLIELHKNAIPYRLANPIQDIYNICKELSDYLNYYSGNITMEEITVMKILSNKEGDKEFFKSASDMLKIFNTEYPKTMEMLSKPKRSLPVSANTVRSNSNPTKQNNGQIRYKEL